jgi:hypothetical protein
MPIERRVLRCVLVDGEARDDDGMIERQTAGRLHFADERLDLVRPVLVEKVVLGREQSAADQSQQHDQRHQAAQDVALLLSPRRRCAGRQLDGVHPVLHRPGRLPRRIHLVLAQRRRAGRRGLLGVSDRRHHDGSDFLFLIGQERQSIQFRLDSRLGDRANGRDVGMDPRGGGRLGLAGPTVVLRRRALHGYNGRRRRGGDRRRDCHRRGGLGRWFRLELELVQRPPGALRFHLLEGGQQRLDPRLGLEGHRLERDDGTLGRDDFGGCDFDLGRRRNRSRRRHDWRRNGGWRHDWRRNGGWRHDWR